MSFSAAVQWWEDWQLRLLVLASLFFQYFLFVAAVVRKLRVPHWFRALIWLAYQGGDVVAVYALATLFTRHKEEALATNPASAHLQTLWAPILLMHLGGQDGITAYSIEDNENWRRHLLVSVSQITIAIYVFRKSWWSGNRILLRAAILLFIPGILKCLEKPWALKNATVETILNSSDSRLKETLEFLDDDAQQKEKDMNSQEKYVQAAAECVAKPGKPEEDDLADHPYHLLVDRGHPYSIRLRNLRLVAPRSPRDEAAADAHDLVRSALSKAFDRLYTKHKASYGGLLRAAVALVTFVVIGMFHRRHRGVYDRADLVVTYVLLSCTAALELVSACLVLASSLPPPDDKLAQYNLFGYLARNEKHPWFWALARLLGARVLLDRLWCTAPPTPSRGGVTTLVYDHVARGWKDYIGKSEYSPAGKWEKTTSDVRAYRRFNDSRGRRTLEREGCGGLKAIEENQKSHEGEASSSQNSSEETQMSHEGEASSSQNPSEERKGCRRWRAIEESLRMPFDVSVLLWHLATEFCYFDHVDTGNDAIRHSRIVSNYMAYLLFVQPEMLIPGARSKLFRATYEELRNMIKPPPKDELAEAEQEPAAKKPRSESEMVREVIQKVKRTIGLRPLGSENVVHKAWAIANELKEFAKEKKTEFVQDQKARNDKMTNLKEVTENLKVAMKDLNDKAVEHMEGNDISVMEVAENFIDLAEKFIDVEKKKKQTKEEEKLTRLLEKAKNKAAEFIVKYDNEMKPEEPTNNEPKEAEAMDKKKKKEKEEEEKKKKEQMVDELSSIAQLVDEEIECQLAEETKKQAQLTNLVARNLITDEEELLMIRAREHGDDKMWAVIQGVWVEMLCFSAGRCRGYLHAKSLANGGEYLSYVWLLLSYMGMETMPERTQRPELPAVGDETMPTESPDKPAAGDKTTMWERMERPELPMVRDTGALVRTRTDIEEDMDYPRGAQMV